MDTEQFIYKSKKLPQKDVDVITQRIYNKSLNYIDRKRKLIQGMKEIDDPECTFQPNYSKKLKDKNQKQRDSLYSFEARERSGILSTKIQLKNQNQLRRELVNLKVMKPYNQHLKLAEEAAFVREQDFIRRFPNHYPQKELKLATEMEMFNQSIKNRYW